MTASPDTRGSLLLRIRNAQDVDAWDEFVDVYAPLIHSYAMRRGLQDADAADVAQQVLHSVAGAIADFAYDPTKGSFRGWLFTVTRNQVLNTIRSSRRVPTATGQTTFHRVLSEQTDRVDERQQWDQEHEQYLFRWASKKAQTEFKPSTWQAFWAVCVEGRAVADVAQSLAMTTGSVYIAKSRVTARLRALIASVETT